MAQTNRFRQGKAKEFTWAILTNDEAKALAGRDLRLDIVDPNGRRRQHPFVITDTNKIQFRINPDDQKVLGWYTLTLWENFGKVNSTAIDLCNAYDVVATTCDEADVLNGLDTDILILPDSNLEIGFTGASAYELWENEPENKGKTYEEYKNWLRQDSLEAAEKALAAEQSVVAAEELRVEEERKRVEAEKLRVSDETERINAEKLRIDKEAERIAAEKLRVEEDLKRATAEKARVDAEAKRVVEENLRAEEEGKRSTEEKLRSEAEVRRANDERMRADEEVKRINAERVRIDDESKRVAAEQVRVNEELKRVAAEQARVAAESERVAAEETRVTEFGRLKTESEGATQKANEAAGTIEGKIKPVVDNDKLQDKTLAALELEDDKNARVIAKALVEHEENIALVRSHLIGLLSQWTGIKDDIRKEAESMLGAPELIAKVTAQALLELMNYVENLHNVVLGVFGGETPLEVLKIQNVKYRGCDPCLYGGTAPGKAPEFIGQHYVDTVGKIAYIAVGTERVDDWVAINVKLQ